MAERDPGELWERMPYGEMLTREEFAEVYPLFFAAMEDVRYGVKPQDSQSFQEFLDYFGMTERNFDWDDFRNWYDGA